MLYYEYDEKRTNINTKTKMLAVWMGMDTTKTRGNFVS